MNRGRSRSVWLMAALFLVTLGALTLSGAVGKGEKAPAFTLPDLKGGDISLSGVVKKNKVTILNFWGIWCPYCVKEIPELISFYNGHRDREVALLAIDYGDHADKVRAYAKEQKIPFPILLDGGRVTQAYGVRLFPTTILLDRRGTIRDVIVGSTTALQLAAKVRPLLEEG